MSVKIRLKRLGKIRTPQYRVVVMDARTKRDGRAIEEIGKYHPKEEPSLIEIDSERAQYWLGVGAQPTEQVTALLKITGDWQKHKGEPGTEGTLKVKAPKPDKRALYEAALAASQNAADDKSKGSATTTKKKAEKVEAEVKAADAKAVAADKADEVEVPVEEPKADVEAALVDGGFGADSAAPAADGSAPEGFTVKGNKDSMKYHVAGSRWYDATEAEVWFKTAEAAAAAGFEPAGGEAAQKVEA
ncbi:hypothetical protein VV02_11840 [Luteipulveratus mongoliensis]|uniref:Small ribosomal subunit protein bS16 n=1 Tax=Luteipulveratus mongoliensis TaxID=571913 RepID=A0A0K1JII7_9MICO|nr:hypothetical protein VV02_11840 [Luteipulveratus mongoliensis]